MKFETGNTVSKHVTPNAVNNVPIHPNTCTDNGKSTLMQSDANESKPRCVIPDAGKERSEHAKLRDESELPSAQKSRIRMAEPDRLKP